MTVVPPFPGDDPITVAPGPALATCASHATVTSDLAMTVWTSLPECSFYARPVAEEGLGRSGTGAPT